MTLGARDEVSKDFASRQSHNQSINQQNERLTSKNLFADSIDPKNMTTIMATPPPFTNDTTVNMHAPKSTSPGHLQERVDALEKRLQTLIDTRSSTQVSRCYAAKKPFVSSKTSHFLSRFPVRQTSITQSQDELSKLFRESPSRPQDSLEQLNARITYVPFRNTLSF
jgi:hypothetical protein